MGRVLHRDYTIDCPVPLFQATGEKDDYGRDIYYFTPHLIQGVYNKITDMFITNPNFSPVFDPSGLVYSTEQINNFWSINQVQWVKYAKSRNKLSYQELYHMDKNQETFKEYVESYSKYFGVRPIPKTIFKATSYQQELNQMLVLEKDFTNNAKK